MRADQTCTLVLKVDLKLNKYPSLAFECMNIMKIVASLPCSNHFLQTLSICNHYTQEMSCVFRWASHPICHSLQWRCFTHSMPLLFVLSILFSIIFLISEQSCIWAHSLLTSKQQLCQYEFRDSWGWDFCLLSKNKHQDFK